MTNVAGLLVQLLCLITFVHSAILHHCTNHPNGECANLYQYRCAAGAHMSYSGCSFLEVCCYRDDDDPTPGPTTEPISGSATSPPNHIVHNGKCGQPDVNSHSLIVGGGNVNIKEYPWQVSLRIRGQHICGGSVINDQWILTAAHCTMDQQGHLFTHQMYTIVAGSTDSLYPSSSHVHKVAGILSHAKYRTGVNKYDIALFKLSKKLDLTTSSVKPICLPKAGSKFGGSMCAATGWGYVKEPVGQATSDNTNEHLKEVTLPIVDTNTCEYMMGYVNKGVLCAGEVHGGRDTCQGDSGGPLACVKDGAYVQAGIVSNGVGCARKNAYGFYTDVSYYLDWINAVIKKY